MATRTWLLTNTTYGTWLPGDARGSVSSERIDPNEPRQEFDRLGDASTPASPALVESSRRLMKGQAIWLTAPQAEAVARQFEETCRYRGWFLLALAIMSNHLHAVVEAADSWTGERIHNDLKAYASRRLNRVFGKLDTGRWWTTKGSERSMPSEKAVENAIRSVVEKQPNPLVVLEWPRGETTSIRHWPTVDQTPVADAPGSGHQEHRSLNFP